MLKGSEADTAHLLSRRDIGFRLDCLGDMKTDSSGHMLAKYPYWIIQSGWRDLWRKAPVSFESCGTMESWLRRGYDLDYIIEQSLKWHISTFNPKSGPIPAEWMPKVESWLKRMGYRLALRRFQYPAEASPNGKLAFSAWWENKGVAPCYRPYRSAIRLQRGSYAVVFPTDADITSWLPGDTLHESAIFLPPDIAVGEYDLSVALVDDTTHEPRIRLAIAGRPADGWYPLGKLRIVAPALKN